MGSKTVEIASPSDEQAGSVTERSVWVLCRQTVGGNVEFLRAFDNEPRARADLDLATVISSDEFWIAGIPMMSSRVRDAAPVPSPHAPSPVQALALTWLARGAHAEAMVPITDPVVVRPSEVRGFVSVPPHEWREMEDLGWIRDEMITPAGAAVIGDNEPYGLDVKSA